MSILSDETLLAQIDAFLQRTGMSPTRFGLDATGEGGLIKSVREGRSLTLRNANRIVDFMRDYTAPANTPSCGKSGDVAAQGQAA